MENGFLLDIQMNHSSLQLLWWRELFMVYQDFEWLEPLITFLENA